MSKLVWSSRFQAGATGDQVLFRKGDEMNYRESDGRLTRVTIDSEPMDHPQAKHHGYECVFHDSGARAFAESIYLSGWGP